MRPLLLTTETKAILTRIRTYGRTLSVYGIGQSAAWRLVEARTRRRLMDTGVTIIAVNMYRRYLHELIRAFRTETGERLAAAIELAIRKWANFGMDCSLLQGLMGDCFRRFEQHGYSGSTVASPVTGRKPGPRGRRRLRRSYAGALRKGRASLSDGAAVEDQAASQESGAAWAADVAARLKPVLRARAIPGDQFVAYFAFAQKLGRLCRRYAARALAMAAADLIDRYEAKSLDPDALVAIAVILFGVTDLG